MNSITLRTPRRIYKSPSTREIPHGTRNKCFNFPDRAADIFEGAARKLHVSEACLAKLAIAEKIQRIDTWAGLAFRAACRLTNEVVAGAKSIFAPASPVQQAEAFKAAMEAEQIERAQAGPNADALIEDLTKPMPNGEFVPTK